MTSATYTVRQLEGITVTSPARTVYSVGQSFDPTGMKVTATYDDGTTRTVTGTITTDTSTLTESAGIGKTVTVSYMEGGITREASFTIDVASYQFTETVQDTGGTYKKFGDWPQTIKEEDVEIGAGTLVRGGLTYYVGNDGNYYVKAEEKAYDAGYKYSDGSGVNQKDESSSPSTRWFKVEPIVWRVLTTSYKAPEGGTAGNALLLAEKILTGGIKWADSSNKYKESYIRQWLNGNSGTRETSDYNGDAGFLQTAFTESAQKLIADTSVDNSADSTTDKIFLLSHQEATNSEYGFAAHNTRIRVTTDYAKATGAYQGDPSAGYGGWWWLRSPNFYNVSFACFINDYGNADYYIRVDYAIGGVVPALSISLGGN